MHTDNEEE